jgi:hypothetical protein
LNATVIPLLNSGITVELIRSKSVVLQRNVARLLPANSQQSRLLTGILTADLTASFLLSIQ